MQQHGSRHDQIELLAQHCRSQERAGEQIRRPGERRALKHEQARQQKEHAEVHGVEHERVDEKIGEQHDGEDRERARAACGEQFLGDQKRQVGNDHRRQASKEQARAENLGEDRDQQVRQRCVGGGVALVEDRRPAVLVEVQQIRIVVLALVLRERADLQQRNQEEDREDNQARNGRAGPPRFRLLQGAQCTVLIVRGCHGIFGLTFHIDSSNKLANTKRIPCNGRRLLGRAGSHRGVL